MFTETLVGADGTEVIGAGEVHIGALVGAGTAGIIRIGVGITDGGGLGAHGIIRIGDITIHVIILIMEDTITTTEVLVADIILITAPDTEQVMFIPEGELPEHMKLEAEAKLPELPEATADLLLLPLELIMRELPEM